MRLIGNRSRFSRSYDFSPLEKKASNNQVNRRFTVVSPESGSRRVASRVVPQDRPLDR